MARRRRNRRNKTQRRTWTRRQTKPRLRSSFFNPYADYNTRFVEARRTRTTTYKRTKKTASRIVQSAFTTNKPLTKNRTAPPLPYRADPKKIQKALICARRKQRKEVLHAYKKTGKGGQRRPRTNPHSHIKC